MSKSLGSLWSFVRKGGHNDTSSITKRPASPTNALRAMVRTNIEARRKARKGPAPITYEYNGKGSIILPPGAPFDGKPVLIHIAAGWCEAYWCVAEVIETMDGIEHDGFCWCCMDGQSQAELDDAREWMPLPVSCTEVTLDGGHSDE